MNTPVDLSFLRDFAKNDPERIRKYITMFLNHAPAMVSNIEKSLAAKDWKGLKSAAHALKPQVTYMGIKSAEELIKTIEACGASETEEGTAALIEKLKSIFESAYDDLKKEIGNQ